MSRNYPIPEGVEDILDYYDSIPSDDANEQYRYVDFVMMIPWVFQLARPWCVDIYGKDDCNPEVALGAGLTHEALAEMQDQQSSYPSAIRALFQELEIPITESGGGCGGWHLGSVCTQDQADRLCAAFFKRFTPAVKAGLLSCGRHWWGHSSGRSWRPCFKKTFE